MSDEENEDFDTVSAMADRMRLEGKDRQRYIHEHMDRLGYDAVPTYVRREEEGEDDRDRGSGFFGRERREPRSSRDRDAGGRSRRDDRDDWYR
jgi:hypothetical protein